MRRASRALAAAVLATGAMTGAAAAQASDPQPPRDGMTAVQAEQLFDRYELGQARVALQLGPGQLAPFARRLQQLQVVRRRGQRQRQQLLNELNAISRGAEPVDEAALTAKLKALDDLTASVNADERDASAKVEEILDVRQRVRFRVFEQRMERQKLDLMARARAAARSGRGPAPPGP